MISNQKCREEGNVLFLILIAVVLFAALSYAVTSSTRSGGDSISKDKAKSYAAAIVQHATTMRQAVMRLKLSNGCTDETINFRNPNYTNNSGAILNSLNPNSPPGNICDLYAAEGGGVAPVKPSPEAVDPSLVLAPGSWLAGHVGVRVGQFKGNGTDGAAGTVSANDIFMRQTYLKLETCLAINELLKIDNSSGLPPVLIASGAEGSSNSTMAGSMIIDFSSAGSPPAFCINFGGGQYTYYHILVER